MAIMQMFHNTLTYAATKAIKPLCRGATMHTMTATGNTTFTITGGRKGDVIKLHLKSDVTGSRVMTFSTGFTSAGTLTLVASKVSVIQFCYNGTSFQEEFRYTAT